MAVTATNPENECGETIPPLTAHAVSVSLPTWDDNVGYEEGRPDVVGKMKTGYPRFFVHKSIARFADVIAATYGLPTDSAMLFPSHTVAARCLDFFRKQAPELAPSQIRIVDLVTNPEHKHPEDRVLPRVSAVLFPKDRFKIAKTFWQHSGEGVSSRRAEYCHMAFEDGMLLEKSQAGQRMCKGPRRYQKKGSVDLSAHHTAPVREPDGQDPLRFVEERFGRNLDVGFAENAKHAIRRRIAGSLTANVDLEEALKLERDHERARPVAGFSEDDVYLYPCGMSAIFNTHRSLMAAIGQRKSVSYGFPYIDTLKILEKFGPGAIFYGFGSSEELDELEKHLESGEKILALFCEFPGNPLLKAPDLERIRALADKYDFGVVVDETIGNFLNIHVLPFADVVVSSLTKVFSGDSNVMGGSAILNPKGRYYELLKKTWAAEYEDNFWPEDAIFLERNSRDFVSRIERINVNAEAICEVLMKHPKVKQVNYPKYSPTRAFYDRCKRPTGGYGGLLSATFYSTENAIKFFDNLDTAKGPSLGTNFTLSSPYVLLAHFTELDWAASYGVESNLIRFSVGLEDTAELAATFNRALAAMG
ncbi:Cystathionine gamma-synthase [Neofusicoccum parvum]|uniref:cystathionine gamma-synthase n=2 Tax=Neofusicoccum parvum TaxID=310453 RepID=R1EKT9_BOTPV|nr:putative cystathionine gamma-synthase protein [Neofusicoccum parvum UCRNP2]GME22143.1 Cystathionine gamma-synthase [Neofusicoccum parvum]GME35090.1 Cystathionine gamma-synthase [Neofusicoccum parvum]